MDLVINDGNSYQNFLTEKRIFWNIIYKKAQKILFIQFGIGILLLIIGFSPLNTSETKIERINNITHQSETTYQHETINFVGTLGIAFILLGIFSAFSLRKQKEKLMDETSRVGKLYFKNSNESAIKINDEGISFENSAVKRTYRWYVFSGFFQFDDYITLSLDSDGLNNLFINRELVSDEIFQNLVNFLRLKIPEKRF
jgi:hypothetical protein